MESNRWLVAVVLCGGVAASIWTTSPAAAQSQPAGAALLQPNEPPEGFGVPPPGFVAPTTDPNLARDTSDYPSSEVVGPSMRGRAAGFFAYDFGIPLGGVKDFTANVSPIGLDLQFRGWVTDTLSLGLSAAWSSYVDERPRNTITVENVAITASLYNQMQLTTGRFLAHYYLSRGAIKPYIAPHVGLGWAWFESEAADVELSDSEFSVILGGELGAIFGDDPMLLGSVRYSWLPGVDFRNVVSSVQTVSLQVGVGI